MKGTMSTVLVREKNTKKKYEKDHGILRYVPKNILFYFYWGVCSYNTTDELLATKKWRHSRANESKLTF